MNKQDRINAINKVLEEFFADSTNPRCIKPKVLMGILVQKGIYNKKDQRGGLPLRKLLRELNEENNLKAIPYLFGEKKEKNIYWYFIDKTIDPKDNLVSTKLESPKQSVVATNKKSNGGRVNSDEYYVVGLCDEVLERKASRQHRFPFLVGDAREGRQPVKLPVDAYYEDLNLVVEYCESQHSESTPFFDDKPTVSGVSRGEQRRIYDERRQKVLPDHGIKVITIHYSDFGKTKRIKRNHEHDIEIVREKLKEYVKGKS